MHNTNLYNTVSPFTVISRFHAQPLKDQIGGRLILGLSTAGIATLLLCTTSALFSLPIIVPVVASIAAVHFTLGFFPEIGITLLIPFTFVGNLINLNQLGIAFATKTTLLFNLTSFGLIIPIAFILASILCVVIYLGLKLNLI